MEHTAFTLRVNKLKKRILERHAENHGMSLSELFRVGAEFYGALPPNFLAWLQHYADEIEIPLESVLVQACQKLIAQYKAWINVFGTPPPGYMREFKWKDGKMVKGDELSAELEAEYTEIFQELKANLVESQETGEACLLTPEQAFQVMAQR